ncbi:MAG: SPOR domain-containing protein [Bacteroidetes bacterium]|nr:SPOR domain-containing protein [Bacteroidota bacterium]
MPNLNVKGDAPKGGGASAAGGGGIPKVVIIILGAVVALAAVAFILNTTGIVKLWGKKKVTPQVVALPQDNFSPVTADTTTVPVDAAMTEEPAPAVAEENLTKVETSARPMPRKQAAPVKGMVKGTGAYTVQISSWPSRERAEVIARIFSDAGFDAFVEPMGSYHRVCVGRFETKTDAKLQMDKMEHMLESRPVIAKLGK